MVLLVPGSNLKPVALGPLLPPWVTRPGQIVSSHWLTTYISRVPTLPPCRGTIFCFMWCSEDAKVAKHVASRKASCKDRGEGIVAFRNRFMLPSQLQFAYNLLLRLSGLCYEIKLACTEASVNAVCFQRSDRFGPARLDLKAEFLLMQPSARGPDAGVSGGGPVVRGRLQNGGLSE